MTLPFFSRTRTVAKSSPVSPLPFVPPVKPTHDAGSCSQCESARSAAWSGGSMDAQMLVYCLGCGSYWLTGSQLRATG